MTYKEFLGDLRASLYGKTAHFLGVPLPVAKIGARASDLAGIGPVGMDTLSMLVDGNVASANAAPELLGRAPKSTAEFPRVASAAGKLVFLYDGACGICSAESERLRGWNRARDTLTFVDISAEGFDPARYGRSMDELMGRVHAIPPEGSMLIGMDAIRAAYAEVGLGWLLAPTRWPGLRIAFDRFYLWFARNRYTLSDIVCRDGKRCAIRGDRETR